MYQQIVKNKGKTYRINCVSYDVGPAGPMGQIWMQSTDGQWYAGQVGGSTSTGVSLYVNQSALTWASVGGQDFPYQYLLNSTDGNVYVVSYTGVPPNVVFSINQTPLFASVAGIVNYKTGFLFQSITDGYYYGASLIGTPPNVTLNVAQNGIWINGGIPPITSSASMVYTYRITENGSFRITEAGDSRII
jgi:hypothetical protein